METEGDVERGKSLITERYNEMDFGKLLHRAYADDLETEEIRQFALEYLFFREFFSAAAYGLSMLIMNKLIVEKIAAFEQECDEDDVDPHDLAAVAVLDVPGQVGIDVGGANWLEAVTLAMAAVESGDITDDDVERIFSDFMYWHLDGRDPILTADTLNKWFLALCEGVGQTPETMVLRYLEPDDPIHVKLREIWKDLLQRGFASYRQKLQ